VLRELGLVSLLPCRTRKSPRADAQSIREQKVPIFSHLQHGPLPNAAVTCWIGESTKQEPAMDEALRENSGFLPDAIGVVWDEVVNGGAKPRLDVARQHMAPNGFLHAASVIGLADSACGIGCMASLPTGANSFTTIELKANFLGTARQGETISVSARLVHGGRTTQVWDAEVSNDTAGKKIALFRCTQLLLYPRTP
jgi:1,4-dihydroxy-2-naphthoyl-CoA hydrolase